MTGATALRIEKRVLDAMMEHGRRQAPNEACGYLAAKEDLICRHFELTNTDAAPDHFRMDPAEQFAAIRRMREQGLRPAAVYHSHPETPARPSAEDIRLAHDPETVSVIVSLLEDGEPVRGFRIRGGEVSEVELKIEETAMETSAEIAASRNLRGVSCPMNLVHTKVALAAIQAGQVLEIILDDGPPINNVPGSVTKEGHAILSRTRLEDGAWSVLVRKA